MAVAIAYALAIQALMTSVGLGMAVGATPAQAGLVLCSFAPHRIAPAPGDRQAPAPQCPFCFIAAQSSGSLATADEAPAFPAYTGLLSDAITRPRSDGVFVAQFRHRDGEPRAPPGVSV